ncbi:BspA family leucine-rich repeat surface protein [Lactococcus piscium]|uniref:Cell surface protein, DUF208-containing n=1 Tax=Pseudolactococcus piscium MKFS47 TaxID=297352 RepID=A0A0D6DUC6_9LACT|nr:BspA family leucine-rich repeat surface protein [Lactococcus piscium]CEN27569.1 Cell surface protein, DUF208-containing [Lactococcus piscium MKFS47]
MKQNKLFTLFSLTLLSGAPLTSIVQADIIKQDSSVIKAVSNKDTKSSTKIEAKSSVTDTWGNTPWTFDADSGIVTIASGQLGTYKTSPWNRTDDKKIDGNQIKKIIFTGTTKAPDDCRALFRNLKSLTEIVGLEKLDTSDVTEMSAMFELCISLTSLDLSKLNVSKVNSTVDMFNQCKALTSLNLLELNTSSLTNMGRMFKGCTSLKSLDFSSFNTLNVTTMQGMFSDTRLTSITLGDKSKFRGTDCKLALFAPDAQNEGRYETGKVMKQGEPQNAFSPLDFFKGYGKISSLTPGTYVAETLPLSWGDAAWSFDDSTGTLTVKSGTLDENAKMSPWERQDGRGINANKIKKIVFTGAVKAPANSASLFNNLSALTEIVGLEKLDTSNARTMSGMFENCLALTSLDLSTFETKQVKTMTNMFENVPLSSLTLGDKFKFIGTDSGLSIPDTLPDGTPLTGNWIRQDSNSKAYNTTDFTANYGKGDLKSGTYITEIEHAEWGDAPWTFASDSGILTIGAGQLDTYKSAPWNRTDDKKIDGNQIKKIIFTGTTKAPDDCRALFRNLKSLTEIVGLEKLDTSDVTEMSAMFELCISLTSLDLSKLNVSKVNSTVDMFNQCKALTNLNLLGMNTSSLTNMGRMFKGCSSLKSLDLSSFNTSNVTTMQGMFSDTSLSSLTLGDNSKFRGEDLDLPAPSALNEGDDLTGNWVRQDGNSKAYSPKDFTANYGKGDLKFGTYIAEIKSSK